MLLDESGHSDNEDEDWEKWMPDPVDADPCKLYLSFKQMSELVSDWCLMPTQQFFSDIMERTS